MQAAQAKPRPAAARRQRLWGMPLVGRIRRAALLREENLVLIERRTASLKRWYGRRIDHAHGLAASHPDERVRRMSTGRLVSLQARLDAEVAKAEASAQVDHETDTRALVVLTVEAAQAARVGRKS